MATERTVKRGLYNPALYDDWAWGLAAIDNMTDAQIAKEFGIKPQTLVEWLKRYPSLAASLKDGRANPNQRVIRSLYSKAIGYTHERRKTVHKTVTNIVGLVIQEEVTETIEEMHIPPSDVACIYWSKNRMPKEWRDRPIEAGSIDTAGVEKFLTAISPEADDVADMFGVPASEDAE